MWNPDLKLGALRVPDPKSINPQLRSVFIQGFPWVKNPGEFLEGEVVVISDESAYNSLLNDGWASADIPDEFAGG